MPSSSATDLKIFIGLGLGALLLMFTLPVFLGYVTVLKYEGEQQMKQGQTADTYNEPLGELGSHCGGPSRLPCRPGLTCNNDQNGKDSVGTCVASSSSSTGSSYLPGQINQACDLSHAPA